jgi:hypothetical protein
MRATTIYGVVQRLGGIVELRNAADRLTGGYAVDDLELGLEDATIDVEHDPELVAGQVIYAEITEQGQFAAVGVLEGAVAEAVAVIGEPLYFSGTYAADGAPADRTRSFVSPSARVLGMSLTVEPANSTAMPLRWKRGDIRRDSDRRDWPISWRSESPLLARAADSMIGVPLTQLRNRSAARISDLRPDPNAPPTWGLKPGDPAPAGWRSRQLPNGLRRSAHAGRILSVR